EVLKRDAWIEYWQARAEGQSEAALDQNLEHRLATQDEEFAFVAACNLGGETMAENDLLRLEQFAQRRWLRTLDDRLGVSWEELERKQRSPAAALPTLEPLLADKPEHLIERTASDQLAPDNPW